MIRTTSRSALLFGLLLALGVSPRGAAADEALAESQGGPAASEAATPGAFPAARLAWLPLTPVQRAALTADQPRLAGRLAALARRGESLARQLADPKLADTARAPLESQRDKIDAEAHGLLEEVRALDVGAALEPAVLRAVVAAPDGPLAELRHAMALGPHVTELDPDTRELVDYVRVCVEGALLALHTQRDVLPDAWKEVSLGSEDAAVRKELATRTQQALDRHVRSIERRWWTFLDYILDREARAAWFRALPPDWLQKVDAAQQLYDLPEITPSQAAQIASRLTEYEAEASPDQAAVRRLQVALRATTDADGRKAMRRELTDAQRRLGEIGVALAQGIRSLLTPEQFEAYEAVPPRISANDRRRRPEQVLEGIRFSAAQSTRLAEMRQEVAGTVKAMQTRAAELTRERAAYGPDAPQQMMMMTELAEIRGDGARLTRRALGTVFREVLTREQLLTWMLDPRGR